MFHDVRWGNLRAFFQERVEVVYVDVFSVSLQNQF